MLTPRYAAQRGQADHGWLNAQHSFSFGDYYDRAHMGYSNLRVINEDRVAAGAGFAPHGHRDMEIITYPLSGVIRHRDSTGGEGEIRHGEIQVMHAGAGIRHSEMNGSAHEPLHLLQIWIEPNVSGVAPGYEQAAVDATGVQGRFGLVVAPKASAEAAPFQIHADARLYLAWLAVGEHTTQTLNPQRRYYLHVATGAVQLGSLHLTAGDAVKIEGESQVQLTASEAAQVLLFDLP